MSRLDDTETTAAADLAAPRADVDAGIADGSRRRLDPQVIVVERITAAIAGAVVGLGGLVATVVLAVARSFGVTGLAAALAGWVVLCALLAAWIWWWPAKRYSYVSYVVSGQGIEIRSGVLWRSVHSVPRSRVQHTDVSQGPVERSFGLATLVIYTAGTEHASVQLGGLDHATATGIRDHLIEGGADDAV